MKRVITLLTALMAVAILQAQDSTSVPSSVPATPIVPSVPAVAVPVPVPVPVNVPDSVPVPVNVPDTVPVPVPVNVPVPVPVPDTIPVVSLLTCSPGVEIWEQYGHTAIRYQDPSQDIDVVFNYGLFSFQAPHFIWRFCTGQTDYVVGVEDYPYFEQEYMERGSSITTQVLDLTPDEVRQFWNLITTNCRKENRTYRYNFFYKNCSTMARDILYRSLSTPPTFVPLAETSLRDILHEHNAAYPWSSFAVDMVLGVEADRPVDHAIQEFAPDRLRQTFALASKGGGKLVRETTTLGPLNPYPAFFHFPLTPREAMLVLLLVTLIVTSLEVLWCRRLWAYDILLFGLQGVAGLVVTFLFFFSGHPAVDSNVLVILLNPLIFALLPLMLRQRRLRKVPWAAMTELLLIAALAVTAPLVGQFVPEAAQIFVFSLLARTVIYLIHPLVNKHKK